MRGSSGLDAADLQLLARRGALPPWVRASDRGLAPPRRRAPWWTYGRPRAGRRLIDGHDRYVASRMEANLWRLFCVWRDRFAIWQEVTFQPAALDFTRARTVGRRRLTGIRHGITRYRPDFRLVDLSGQVGDVEARPFLDRTAHTRLARARRYFPHCTFWIITGPEYRARAAGTGWCPDGRTVMQEVTLSPQELDALMGTQRVPVSKRELAYWTDRFLDELEAGEDPARRVSLTPAPARRHSLSTWSGACPGRAR